MWCSNLVARTLPRLAAFVLPWMLGCGTEDFQTSPPVDASELYWDLALNHHAVTLALGTSYDTLTLVGVPRSAKGQPIANLPAPVYVSQDPTKITITPDGVLHALGITPQPVLVIATLTARNVKHSDTVRVRVVDVADPPVLTTFSVQPVPPDSAKVAAYFDYIQLPLHAADDHGQPISDLLVAFRSSNDLIARIDATTGQLDPKLEGDVTFYASATAFGIAKADSVHYRVGAPIYVDHLTISLPQPGTDHAPDFPTLTVGVGAIVMWTDFSLPNSPGFSIQFDDADLPNIAPATVFAEFARTRLPRLCTLYAFDCAGAGNIAVLPPVSRAFRVFTAPGTYDYRCTPCGNVGRIVVVDGR